MVFYHDVWFSVRNASANRRDPLVPDQFDVVVLTKGRRLMFPPMLTRLRGFKDELENIPVYRTTQGVMPPQLFTSIQLLLVSMSILSYY